MKKVLGFGFVLTFFIVFPIKSHALSSTVKMSAFIGEHNFSLYGYTSPKALVNFEGLGIFDQTYSDEAGFFKFANRFSPFSPREACLSAIDQFGRLSAPVCLPPFSTKYDVNIGPVILAPTLSLNSPLTGGYFTGDEVTLSGQSIPNTDVNLSLFTNDVGVASNERARHARLDSTIESKRAGPLQLIKPVYAFSFPQLTTHTDGKGNFSISLPSETAKKYRLFAQTTYDRSRSPRSITLNLQIYPWWMWMIRLFGLIIAILGNRIIEVIIIAEIAGLVIYLLRLHFRPHALVKYKMSFLVK